MTFSIADVSPLFSQTRHMEYRETPEGIGLVTVLIQTECDNQTEYSIAVVLLPNPKFPADFRILHSIAQNESVAENIFQKVVRGYVTPCTLDDVVSDLL